MGLSEITPSLQNTLTHDWLFRVLAPFQPPPDLADRIKASLEQAISRSSTVDGPWRVEVKFYVSKAARQSPSSGSWGFFKLEKVRIPGEMNPAMIHAIEYYLYPE